MVQQIQQEMHKTLQTKQHSPQNAQNRLPESAQELDRQVVGMAENEDTFGRWLSTSAIDDHEALRKRMLVKRHRAMLQLVTFNSEILYFTLLKHTTTHPYRLTQQIMLKKLPIKVFNQI